MLSIVEVVVMRGSCKPIVAMLGLAFSVLNLLDATADPAVADVTITRLGEIHPLHSGDSGRGVFADVMLLGNDRVITTYQLAGADSFCQGKSLYFQEFKRDLSPVESQRKIIDVNAEGSIYRQSSERPGDLGDHKFTVLGDTIVMLTTIPGDSEGRLIRFDQTFYPIDDLTDDTQLTRIGDQNQEDRLLDMGFANDGSYLYAQFYNQPINSPPASWGAQLYKYQLDDDFEQIGEKVVQPEEGIFLTGTSLVYVPEGMMGATEDRLQNFSPNRAPDSDEPSGIHTFAVKASDLSLIKGSTRTIAESALDLYFSTGADWNEKHQLWVVGYTEEIAAGIHGLQFPEANACRGGVKPAGEIYRELGPSFISIYDAEWNEIQTIALNDGDYAFRVMLETEGDDIYVAYDEMDLYAWNPVSQAKLEHFQITGQSPAVLQWNTSGTGSWGDPVNWDPTGGPPDGQGATAVFAETITTPTSVVTAEAVTLNRIEFNNSTHRYTLIGVGSVNLMADTTNGVTKPTVVVKGAHRFQVDVNLLDDTTIDVTGDGIVEFNNRFSMAGNTLTKIGEGELAINDVFNAGEGAVDVLSGTLSGRGTIAGDVINAAGMISPGSHRSGVSVIPEPRGWMLLLFGAGGIAVRRRWHLS